MASHTTEMKSLSLEMWKASCWGEVRLHTPKLLPVGWGLWQGCYLVPGPSNVALFQIKPEDGKSMKLRKPNKVIRCDQVEAVDQSGRVVCLRRKCRDIAWLRFPDDSAVSAFIEKASPLIEKPSFDLAKEQKRRRCADSKKKHAGKSRKAKKQKAMPCNKFEACLQHWAFPLFSMEAFAKENWCVKQDNIMRKIVPLDKIVEEDESTDEGESGSCDSPPSSCPGTPKRGRSFFAFLRNDSVESLSFHVRELCEKYPTECNAQNSWHLESCLLDYQLF